MGLCCILSISDFQNKVAAAAAAVAALDESESQQHVVAALPAKQKRPATGYQEPRQAKTFQVPADPGPDPDPRIVSSF
jgi:hypothetical protein